MFNTPAQGVQHRVFHLDGHPSRYQPRPTGLNFGEQTGTGVFPLVIAVPHEVKSCELYIYKYIHCTDEAQKADTVLSAVRYSSLV